MNLPDLKTQTPFSVMRRKQLLKNAMTSPAQAEEASRLPLSDG